MLPATTLGEVESFLSRRNFNDFPHRRRMLGLLFARPSVKLAKDQIFPNLEYFDRRSFTHMDFYCAGVSSGDWSRKSGDFSPVEYILRTSPHPGPLSIKDYESSSRFLYSDNQFLKFCREVESRSSWKYSGETELLLLDCEVKDKNSLRPKVILDFSQVIVMNLEELIRANLIASVSTLFEQILSSIKPTNVLSRRDTFELSDKLAGRAVTTLTYQALMKLLPFQTDQAVKAIQYFRIANLDNSAT